MADISRFGPELSQAEIDALVDNVVIIVLLKTPGSTVESGVFSKRLLIGFKT